MIEPKALPCTHVHPGHTPPLLIPHTVGLGGGGGIPWPSNNPPLPNPLPPLLSLNGGFLTLAPWDTWDTCPLGHLPRAPPLARATPLLCRFRNLCGSFSRGSATSCFRAHPCTHSVQDLIRLTCFGNSRSHGIWRFHFLGFHENQFFFGDSRLGMVFWRHSLLPLHVFSLPLVLWRWRLGNHRTAGTFILH